MGDHDDKPLPRRSSDTRVRVQGDRDTRQGLEPMSRQASPVNVGETFGQFVLEKFLGEGSSGYVYRALDTIAQRHFALKFVNGEPSGNLVRTKLGFRRMMQVEHPNLARADRIHRLGNQIALSMEEIHGTTLAKSMRQFRKQSHETACNHLLELMRDYAAALAAIHGHRFVHRDIKPQNLMIDEQGRGRIIDYGLVGTFDAELDPSGLRNYLVGTPGYFAPEALSNQSYLPAGDIYSLGRVMLEALRVIVGDPLSSIINSEAELGEDLQEQEDSISATLDELAESVPKVLHDACIEMLQPNPGDRPTALQMARLGLPRSISLPWSEEKPMHGRANEYAKLCDWLKSIYAGETGRVHLHGPSGIGKTRLIDEVEKHLRAMPYGQVFRARCRPREDHPLQAFDQITDEIAIRYMKNDLQRAKLDPVSAGILLEIFPVLKNVIEVNMELPPPHARTGHHDSLEAAMRLSFELRKNGPLIIIIDDIQWADPDSLNVLDNLCETPGGSLGILTVSRRELDAEVDAEHRPPDINIKLQGLAPDESIAMLADEANRWSNDIDLVELRNLAEIVEGNPFRLSELAQEFRPGGLLASTGDCTALTESIAKGESFDWLCRRRVERLSPEARKILPLVVAAGRPVSIQQIDDLTKLGEHIEVPLSELVHQRLVADETQIDECIRVVHDRVADGLVALLSPAEIKQAHRAWADWLLQQDQPHLVAARVAGHLFDADEPSRAISSAILAAKQSEKLYAHRDAAGWYERVLPFVSGTERVQLLRDAARCYETSDLPVQAAKHYQELSKHVDGDEQNECRLTAVKLLIRSGRFAMVRQQLRDLTDDLDLPIPKSPRLGNAAILWQVIRLHLEKKRLRRRTLRNARAKRSLAVKPASIRDQQRLSLCLALARPLSMFDNHHASELNLTAARLALNSDDIKSQLYVEIGSAVFDCYAKGQSRIRGELLLQELRPRIIAFGDDELLGDFWAANAYSHMFACRWQLVCERAKKSVAYYRRLDRSHCYEISNTKSICFWSLWHLGRWGEMAGLHDELLTESVQRNDRVERLVATSGMAASVWLARDEPDALMRAQNENTKFLTRKVGVQYFDHMVWISSMLRAIYCADWDGASELLSVYRSLMRRSPLKGLQVFRVTYLYYGAVVWLHRMQEAPYGKCDPNGKYARNAREYIAGLRAEQLEFTAAAASMLEGLRQLTLMNADTAKDLLRKANRLAEELRLRPLQCAAQDAIKRIDDGIHGDSLCERMRNQDIANPRQFERLYTVRMDDT